MHFAERGGEEVSPGHAIHRKGLDRDDGMNGIGWMTVLPHPEVRR
jgi:hypothetical protein